jgi:hypothetical protein
VTCFGYEGIDAIKRALKEAEECSNSDGEVKVITHLLLDIKENNRWANFEQLLF